jgi:tetratricopeptide (TPR) repeat protein
MYANSDLSTKYNSAIASYNKKDFQTAYKLLSQLYLSKLSDAKLNFYLGRAAYETGHYEIALAAFERVENLDPGNLRNRLEMARTYFMLKMYEDAENTFKEVLENRNIPDNVRRNIELYLAKVTKIQQKSFTYANVTLDWIYDSNVNYSANRNFDYGTISILSDEKSDSAMQLYGDIVNIYDIGEKNGFAIKNRFVGFIKDYRREDNYNLDYIAYNPSLLYKYTKHTIDFGIGIDNLRIAHYTYLQSSYILPRYEYAHTTTLRSIVYFKYQRKNFLQNRDLDANHYELAYSLQNILSPRSYIQVGIDGIKEKKRQGDRYDVNYDEYKIDLTYAKQFTPIIGSEFYAAYRNRSYGDYHPIFKNTRTDNVGTAGATMNVKLIETIDLQLRGTYTVANSNQAAYKYRKYTLAFGLNKTF